MSRWPTLVPAIIPANIPDALVAGPGTYASSPVGVRCFQPGENVVLGNYCSLGCNVQLMTGGSHATHRASTFNFHARGFTETPLIREPDYTPPKTTTIGHDVWIGDGAVIGGGSTIGHGAVIGAYSVVMNKDIPPYAIVVGNPARVIRYRFNERVTAALLRIEWWHWPEEKIIRELPAFYAPIETFIRKHDPHACPVPPDGWTCSRPRGHVGPCAASPENDLPESLPVSWDRRPWKEAP